MTVLYAAQMILECSHRVGTVLIMQSITEIGEGVDFKEELEERCLFCLYI